MPTTKRQKHLARQANKLINQRTKDDRLSEVNTILKGIDNIGFPDNDQNIIKFKSLLTDFLENGTSYNGIIPLLGYGREIHYLLSNNKNIKLNVLLRVNNNLK